MSCWTRDTQLTKSSVYIVYYCKCTLYMYGVQVKQGVTSVTEELAKYDPNKKFKYEQLKGRDNCPAGVDPSNKEVSWQLQAHGRERS